MQIPGHKVLNQTDSSRHYHCNISKLHLTINPGLNPDVDHVRFTRFLVDMQKDPTLLIDDQIPGASDLIAERLAEEREVQRLAEERETQRLVEVAFEKQRLEEEHAARETERVAEATRTQLVVNNLGNPLPENVPENDAEKVAREAAEYAALEAEEAEKSKTK